MQCHRDTSNSKGAEQTGNFTSYTDFVSMHMVGEMVSFKQYFFIVLL